MSLLLKVLVFAVAAAVLSSVLKESRPEYVLPVQIGFAVIILSYIIAFSSRKISGLFENTFAGAVDMKYITVMLKGAIVSTACTLCSSLCRESGNRVLGDIVEISGRVIIILFCVPLIESVAETALMYLK
ncbi:MAG: SpoIIIAC/SpoIIIAD family protein [Clostridia bacterium]|nr:SpoIIIAC/SpoIIIAD family protein [Clostridia bacterium]